MEGIGIVEFYKKDIYGPVKKVVTNINELRKRIIKLFGETACRMYGLIQKSPAEVLGM